MSDDPDDQADIAPVVPLRSDHEELVALESAVLDDLEERDAEPDPEGAAGADVPPAPPWLARHPTPEDRPPHP